MAEPVDTSAARRAALTHDQYFVLNMGAQRNPPAICAAPLLTHHRVFWARSHNRGSVIIKTDGDDDWKQLADEWLFGVVKRTLSLLGVRVGDDEKQLALSHNMFRDKNGIPTFRGFVGFFDPFAESFSRRDDNVDGLRNWGKTNLDTVSLTFGQWGLPLKLRCERHNEYMTLTYFLILSELQVPRFETELDRTTRDRFREFSSELRRAIHCLIRHLNSRFNFIVNERPDGTFSFHERSAGQSKIFRESVSALHAKLFDDLWAHDILEEIDGGKEGIEKWSSGYIANFRGIVLDAAVNDADLFKSAQGQTLSPLSGPRSYRDRLPLRYMALRSKFTKTQAADLVSTVYPFLSSSQVDKDVRHHELTASTFIDRQAVYCGVLGAQSKDRIVSNRPSPLTYVIIVKTRNRWQIGRLIERLHHLGTVRLAAIYEADAIATAGAALRNLGLELDAGFDLASKSEAIGVDNRDIAKKNCAEARDRLRNCFIELARIDNGVSGGLAYRVERARYYRQQFDDMVCDLRIGRIEGMQRYDEFVRRKLSTRYDYINRVGLRYDRFKSRLQLLQSLLHNHDIRALNADIRSLQGRAELFAFFVLAPYYLFHVLEAVAKSFGVGSAVESEKFLGAYGLTLWVVVVFLLFIIWSFMKLVD